MAHPDPAARTLISRIGAHRKWANTDDRNAATAPARAALKDRFIREARERYGDLPEHELAIRAEHVRKEYFTRLALLSAEARRRKKAAA